MKVKFYGTRGSIPVCERNFQEFGGNTTCLLVTFASGEIVILDAGSGIRTLGKELTEAGFAWGEHTVTIGFTHFHWDHIQGFPLFGPAYLPEASFVISAIGKERHGLDLEAIFATQMISTYFPVPLDKMGAHFEYHQMPEDSFQNGEVMCSVMLHRHPGGAYSYRLENEGSVFVFCTDIEHGDAVDLEVVRFAQGADLLVHEAQYTPEELRGHRGWGHSSWEQAIEVAEKADVKQLILTHHDPDHDDAFLRGVEKRCQQRFKNVALAREKMEVVF